MGTIETKQKTKISAGTIARTIILVLALINQVLTVLGYSPLPIADDTVNLVVSTIATVIASLVTWWQNNSFTRAAIEADGYLKQVQNKGA